MGKRSEIKSPNGLYAVKNVDEKVSDQAYPKHVLFFVGKGTEKLPLILPSTGTNSYQREVNILWAPDSNFFVLNDWWVSNRSNAYLYRLSDLSHPIDLGNKLKNELTDQQDLTCMENSIHTYIFASKWLDPTSVEVRLAGDYTSKPKFKGRFRQFTIYYVWDLRKHVFQRTKRVPRYEVPAFK